MTSPSPRRNRVCKRAVVQHTERITPHMIRVVLTSDDFAAHRSDWVAPVEIEAA